MMGLLGVPMGSAVRVLSVIMAPLVIILVCILSIMLGLMAAL